MTHYRNGRNRHAGGRERSTRSLNQAAATPTPRYLPGSHVRIARGQWAGLVGQVQGVLSTARPFSYGVRILECSDELELDERDLEPVEIRALAERRLHDHRRALQRYAVWKQTSQTAAAFRARWPRLSPAQAWQLAGWSVRWRSLRARLRALRASRKQPGPAAKAAQERQTP